MTDVFAANDAAVSTVDKIKLLTDAMHAVSTLHGGAKRFLILWAKRQHLLLHIPTFISLLESKPSL